MGAFSKIMGISQADRLRSDSVFGRRVCAEDACDGVALDGLLFSPRSRAYAVGRESVGVAEAACGGLMEHGDGVCGEQLPFAPGAAESLAQVVSDVVGGERVDDETALKSWSRGSGFS